ALARRREHEALRQGVPRDHRHPARHHLRRHLLCPEGQAGVQAGGEVLRPRAQPYRRGVLHHRRGDEGHRLRGERGAALVRWAAAGGPQAPGAGVNAPAPTAHDTVMMERRKMMDRGTLALLALAATTLAAL